MTVAWQDSSLTALLREPSQATESTTRGTSFLKHLRNLTRFLVLAPILGAARDNVVERCGSFRCQTSYLVHRI